MTHIYRIIYDRFLVRLDAETAHRLAIVGLQAAQRTPGGLSALYRLADRPDARLATSQWGLSFANPLGVAAGLDKDAEAFAALFAFGYGHVEVGTVTPKPQRGNPKPRLWRVLEQRGLINALGFPSHGGARVKRRVGDASSRQKREALPRVLGINLGKNATTPLERAHEDYAALVGQLFDSASYFVINISSPNTPGLRELQSAGYLEHLVREVVSANAESAAKRGEAPRPLLVKLAPDLDDAELEQISDNAVNAGANGIVATNTTIDRQGLPAYAVEHPGGLSGAPLFRRANHAISRVYRTVGSKVPIIGVGGVFSAVDVLAHMGAGASLVQLYSGMVYEGPFLAGRILAGLQKAADRDGWANISEVVGSQIS